jgi:hypothetical protein
MSRWKNIRKHPAPVGVKVNIMHDVMGVGAPEREGWISTGTLRESGIWSIKHVEGYSHGKPITHWKELVTN